MNRRAKGLALISALCVGALALSWAAQELRIDACLDAGGRWDYGAKDCDR